MDYCFSGFHCYRCDNTIYFPDCIWYFTAFIQLITGDFTGALQTLQTTFTNVLNIIWTAVQSILHKFLNLYFQL